MVSAHRKRGKRTGSSADIVESELSHPLVQLEEEGKRLANAASSAEDGDLGELCIGDGCQQPPIHCFSLLRKNREEKLTFRAEAEKARRWILDAMNIVKETLKNSDRGGGDCNVYEGGLSRNWRGKQSNA
jgi:hypothetical protein